ncbi:MAG: hypothetical protein K2O45_05520, partial [Oscillospiraceae bacterium]|nr:hypothetical protein [Oscillospiraceae bacterium]
RLRPPSCHTAFSSASFLPILKCVDYSSGFSPEGKVLFDTFSFSRKSINTGQTDRRYASRSACLFAN